MAEPAKREITIRRINPNGVAPIHVNDLLFNHDGQEIYLQFSEIEPPILIGPEDVEKLTSIEAIARVKLVLSPGFLDSMVKLLTERLQKFNLERELKNE